MKYLPFLLVLTLLGCEDRFLKTLDVELPETEQRLAVTAQLSTADLVPSIFVDNIESALTPREDLDFVRDAEVLLSRNGAPFGQFFLFDQPDDFEFRDRYLLDLDALGLDHLPGGDYTLEVSAPGFPSVTATQSVPDTAAIVSTQFEADGFVDIDGFRLDELTLRVDDVPNQENYYRVDIALVESQIIDGDTIVFDNGFNSYPTINDPTITLGWDGEIYFTDGSFSDGSKELRMGIYTFRDSGNESRFQLQVSVNSLSEEAYNYEISRSAFLYSQDNPFAEPVSIVSNIEDGIGIFSVANVSRRLIDLE